MSQSVYPPTVQGDVAHDAVDSGQPVKVGGKVTTGTPTSVANADRVDAFFDARGALGMFVTEKGNASSVSVGTMSGDASGNVIGLYNNVRAAVFNGTTWDRQRGSLLGLDISRAAAAATAALSNVASSATNVTLLASNAARKGASIHNDSAAVLYVKFGATASSTSFTVKMAADAYFEVPFGYTGIIDGIWASADGAARVTELT